MNLWASELANYQTTSQYLWQMFSHTCQPQYSFCNKTLRILLVVFERCVFYLFLWYTFQENDLGDMRPKYIKAKEKTAHVTQRLETKKYAKQLLTDEQDLKCLLSLPVKASLEPAKTSLDKSLQTFITSPDYVPQQQQLKC